MENCHCKCDCNLHTHHPVPEKPHHFCWDDEPQDLNLLDAELHDRVKNIIRRAIMDSENEFKSMIGDFDVDETLQQTLSYNLINELRVLVED